MEYIRQIKTYIILKLEKKPFVCLWKEKTIIKKINGDGTGQAFWTIGKNKNRKVCILYFLI
jgi:hypothetical protein